MKTIEEVKEYFKNAKVVECLGDGKHYKVDLRTLHVECEMYCLLTINNEHDSNDILLTSLNKEGFAKIIEYKDQSIKIGDMVLVSKGRSVDSEYLDGQIVEVEEVSKNCITLKGHNGGCHRDELTKIEKDEKLYTLKEECHKYIGAQTR